MNKWQKKWLKILKEADEEELASILDDIYEEGYSDAVRDNYNEHEPIPWEDLD